MRIPRSSRSRGERFAASSAAASNGRTSRTSSARVVQRTIVYLRVPDHRMRRAAKLCNTYKPLRLPVARRAARW
jgi:hypothetical protein